MQVRKLKTKSRKFEQVKDSKGNPVPSLFRHIPSGRIHVRKNFRKLGIPALSQTTGQVTLGRARTAADIIVQRHRNYHLGIDDSVTFGKRRSITVSELIKKFLSEYTHAPDQGLRARTKLKHEWFFNEIDRELGGMGVESITVETFRAWMRQKSQTRASLFDYAKHLTLLFRFAHNHKLVSHPIKFPDPNRGEKVHEDRVYTDLEIEKIWNALNEDGKDQFVLSYECMMRLGEVLNLEWDRVNLKTGEIILRDEHVKTGRGRRFIASSHAINRLEQRAKRLPKGISRFVFPSPTNSQKPVIHNRGTWRTAKRDAGIKGRATWHALRHTALTKALLEKNLDPIHVSQYAGVSIGTIERVYLHAKAEHTRKVSGAITIGGEKDHGVNCRTTHEQRGETVDQGDFNFEGEFDIEIVAFTKNNPGKTTGWFKLKNDWFLDPKISHLPESAQLLFVKLVSVRAASGNRLVSVTLPWCQRRVGVRSSSCKRNLIILRNAGLISLERKKEREERGDERVSSETQGLIIPDLVGIDDPLFQTMSEAAQRSWVGKFGLALIRDIVPTAHTSWKTDNPVNPRSGVPVPLIPYVHRWLENGKRFPQKPKEKTFAEALAEREAKREQADI